MKIVKENRGITLIALSVTIIVLAILGITLTTSTQSTIDMKKYYDTKKDILALSETIQKYYIDNDADLSKIEKSKVTDFNIDTLIDGKDKNPNDNENYYEINIEELKDVKISNKDNTYIFNEQSLTVYCKNGFKINGETHYTAIDDASTKVFAKDYYSNVNLPLISIVTFESNEKNTSYATANDTVTLRMLKNYNFTTEPTVTIDGQNVNVTWNGKLGKAEYKVGADKAKNDQKITFSISNYSADGRSGDTITTPTFTDGVLYSYIPKVNIGDYVSYTPDTANNYVAEAINTGYISDQTIGQDTSIKWRVYEQTNDNIKLIADKPTGTTISFTGANGYNNETLIINDLCKLQYSNSFGTAKGISMEEINKYLSFDYTTLANSNTDTGRYGGTKEYTTAKNYPNILAKEKDAWIDGIEGNELDSFDQLSIITGTSIASNREKIKQTSWNKVMLVSDFNDCLNNSSMYYNILVNNGTANYEAYWLSSRCLDAGNDYANYNVNCITNGSINGYNLFNSATSGTSNTGTLAVRPIVTLNHGTKIDTMGAGTDGSITKPWTIK